MNYLHMADNFHFASNFFLYNNEFHLVMYLKWNDYFDLG